jgi:hypothetical protein
MRDYYIGRIYKYKTHYLKIIINYMGDNMKCINRDRKTFKLCNRIAKTNSNFCGYHSNNDLFINKIFKLIFWKKEVIQMIDIYNLYKYITDNINEYKYKEEKAGNLFKSILNNIPFNMLLSLSERYIKCHYNYSKNELYDLLYNLNSKTYNIRNKCVIKKFQNKYKYHLLSKNVDYNYIINGEDLFTCEPISDIPKNKLFILNDIKGIYGFDAIELDYFIRKCYKDKQEPYNPYTREKITKNMIWKLNKFMEYNNIKPKQDNNKWITKLNAYTDLSIELEGKGFYNSPDWFNKMSREKILQSIKYFKDLSYQYSESKLYFLDLENANIEDVDEEEFVFKFCKDAIKMIKENNDLMYVLICNFVKALALCSDDFYENVPTWLSNIDTPSRLGNIFSIFNNYNLEIFSDLNRLEDLRRRDEILNGETDGINVYANPSNNFLLYYYVEYI